MSTVTYRASFSLTPKAARIDHFRAELEKLPQYEPVTKHYFADGMYCREVYNDAEIALVGRVHKKEHFYVIASGTVAVCTNDGVEEIITGPRVLISKPGTRRAVVSLTPTTCLTVHRTNATTVEDAEAELVEDDPYSMYAPGNKLKTGIAHKPHEVLT